MIDFRYHLVSIVAVFLALAIGIVLGTTALPEAVVKPLKTATASLKSDNEKLRVEARQYQSQANASDQFVADVAPQLVAGRLTGERVVIVEAPGVDQNQRDAIAGLITKAGGTITGRVVLRDSYLDSGQDSVIENLTDQLRPAHLQLPNGTPRERAAVELAAAVVTDQGSKAGQENSTGDTILSAFQQAGFISTSGKPALRATLALVLAPQTPFQGKDADHGNDAFIALANALDARSHGAVVTGPTDSIGPGGLIAALRDNGDVAKSVSSVDNCDTATGQVATVYALAAQAHGQVGEYGIGPGVDGVAPSPAPGRGSRS